MATPLGAACTPYLGAVAPDAASRDATFLDAPDAARAEDRPPEEAPPEAPDGSRVCGVERGGCDPVSGTGCAAGMSCQVINFLGTEVACRTPGTHGAFAACAAEGDCAAGLHCVVGRCLHLCCVVGGDGACGASVGSRSRCAVPTQSFFLSACTQPGNCSYPGNEGCAPGSACFPTSAIGESVCQQDGVVAAGGACLAQNECARGYTCVTGAGGAGTCRAICNPSGLNTCGSGASCGRFSDRPVDWGWCSR